MVIEAINGIYDFGQRLSIAPERLTYYTGLFSILHGAISTEFANPLMGGVEVALGAFAVGAVVVNNPPEPARQQR